MEIVDGEQIDIVQQLNASNMMEDHFTFDLCKKGKIHFLLQGQIQDFSRREKGMVGILEFPSKCGSLRTGT